MSGDIADDQDDMTIAYMLGFERGKDAAAATITAQVQEIERLRAALAPFAEMAGAYDPEEGDGHQLAWAHHVTIASLRRARAAIRKETTA